MSKYDEILCLRASQFRRLTGVKKQTFEYMVEILSEAEYKKSRKGGAKNTV